MTIKLKKGIADVLLLPKKLIDLGYKKKSKYSQYMNKDKPVQTKKK